MTAPTEELPAERLLVTRNEAARILSLCVSEIDNLRRAGRLMAKRHGAKVLFPVKELERFANDLPWEADL
ncbi:excise [Mycobacterium phage Halena]|uniref:Helix-turn-helix domain-containing protein n=10 Tax=Bronvirus TaxID=1623278 RepID=E0YPH3_9CAUD|nr:HTH DNA binding protein [Mycobacterium phage LeBron]YP_009635884.1 HTH DNA binding protein [Mycobacterium phage JoeDirt]YP_010100936.1 HTH DNA binding protein [Mycobacterium phage CicholasNage]YP_010101345.1 HTH DNA binding protein [Mycobacterium phage Silverleaf]YP_010105441.1 HTH DNA binding protein [Mycobacterium phage DirkDirk]YP_010114739.1 HTH DNA binding protein [Mycobacterium phage OhShagHennessy]AEK07577.1 hypothetical protein UPIE_40 [Mycobacterium phage UPIE]AEZ50717.1 hypothet